MKKVICVLLTLSLVLSLTACGKQKQKEQEFSLDEISYVLPEHVEAKVVENSTDDSHAVINIINTSDKPVTFMVEYKLEKSIDGQWFEMLPLTKIDWDTTLYTVEPNTAKKTTVSFLVAHNKLEAGTYRILRQVYVPDDKSTYYMDCEFTLS